MCVCDCVIVCVCMCVCVCVTVCVYVLHYVHLLQGWKDRYFVLAHGKLSYFKNEKVRQLHWETHIKFYYNYIHASLH